jgi:hypothetical protein
LRCSTHTIIIKINLHPLFYPLFLSTSPCSRGATWMVDRWRRSSRAARPARAIHSRCMPWQGPSRACGVSGLKIPRWHVLRIALLARLLRWRVLQIMLIARGTRSKCGYPLGSGQLKSWLGPASSDLAPYQCGDLSKHQYTLAKFLGPQMISNKKIYQLQSCCSHRHLQLRFWSIFYPRSFKHFDFQNFRTSNINLRL